jgi:hypothetical protein
VLDPVVETVFVARVTSPDLSAFAGDPAASAVLDRMRDGRWRKARDAAKELCKKERTRYLPLLVEANAGLVREMHAKGLFKEAETVLAYLETIAPAEWVAGLRAERVEAAAKPVAGAGPGPIGGGASGWAVTLRVDRDLADGREILPADLAAVDQLVVDSFVPPVTGGDDAATRLAAELAAVRTACDATGDGRWEEAKEALRGLPQRSLFRHWRMFLRGVRCVFEEDLETARRCFGELPAGGALARAAGTFDPAPGKPSAPARARVPLLLAASGQPAAWGEPILAATVAWQAGKRVKAFEELRNGLKGEFPTQRPGLGSALTDAIVPYGRRMGDADYEFADELTARLARHSGKRTGPAAEALLALMRPMCVVEAAQLLPSELEESWRTVLLLWNDREGPDRERDSAAWHWLGEALAMPGPPSSGIFGYGESREPTYRRARQALEKSVELDPQNEAAWLSLLGVISRQQDPKEHNRLLGELVKRFPRNKQILVLAGNEALLRKTYAKGLAALEAALALDPLDKQVKVSLLVALVLQTREFLRKGRPVAGQWAAMEPLLEDRPGRANLMLARWIARVRQGLLDPDPEAAGRARADASRLAPSPLERLFLEDSLAAIYKVKVAGSWQKSWQEALGGTSLAWNVLTKLLDLNDFAAQIHDGGKEQRARGARVQEVLGHLLSQGLDKDPDGLLVFLEDSAHLAKDRESTGASLLRRCLRDLCDALEGEVDTGRKRKKADPRLRLAALMSLEITGSYLYTDKAGFFRDLVEVAADAAALEMNGAATRAEAMLKRMSEREKEGYVDEEDDEADDFVDPFGDAPLDESQEPPAGAADLMDMVERFVAAAQSGNQRAIAAARDGLLAMGVPEEILQKAIGEAEPVGTQPPKPAAKKKPKQTRQPAGPPPPPFDQLDLFE